jgi:tetraacyldisaccharide 4'-kinase
MNRAATFALTPASLAYGLGVRLRNRLFRSGALKTHEIDAPVISVGNLTTGGTGKTPLVKWLAIELSSSGQRVCVLTRGYRRNSSGRIVVSDNDSLRANFDQAGDEPFLLGQELQGRAAVVCDANRVAAAEWAIKNLSSQTFILDDAFQHQRIRRDFNILTVDATNSWGNRKLLPAGILREPISQLTRADCIVITRADEVDTSELLAEIRSLAGNIPIFTSRMRLVQARALGGPYQTEAIHRQDPVAAFCGIGNPDSFFSLLRREAFDVVHERAFRDHYRYTQADIHRLTTEAIARGAKAIVTTAKDAVKLGELKFELPCLVIDVTIEIEHEREFLSQVEHALENRQMNLRRCR